MCKREKHYCTHILRFHYREMCLRVDYGIMRNSVILEVTLCNEVIAQSIAKMDLKYKGMIVQMGANCPSREKVLVCTWRGSSILTDCVPKCAFETLMSDEAKSDGRTEFQNVAWIPYSWQCWESIPGSGDVRIRHYWYQINLGWCRWYLI